ncbi:serine/threonine-protein kinase [Candidatus Uabimicrobium amorphum]|uniref:Protein kinase n=1 Tax=Uabimicrobium amorphum TaxID=2596890 RepID=A0A5S9IM17_UABAM|nr:serine/threonine-protein kinase [Candidatus Uabimicrobium amorphum]BBM84359.1 protein kinase [Candidatus Uabimicrobium amorphum]
MDDFAKTQVNISIGNAWNGYQVVGKIGSGGMGVVYKAIQQNPQRTVAIKVDTSAQQGYSRFTREMQIVAELDHPNIGRVYDAGVIQQYRYMVMEFIDGQPLDEYLQNNDLSLQDKIKIFIQICTALGYAHRRGIVHRDLKPANILIRPNHNPIIIDFGLAKKVGNNQQFDLTKTGDVLGTPAYMAPEQVSGKGSAIHAQTDIYAIGAILYEAVTGQRMITGDGALEILFKIQHETVLSPSRIEPQLDKRIDTIWEKATTRKQEYRYKNISMFANDLKLFLQDGHIKTNYTFFHRFKWAITALMFIVFSIVFVVWSSKEQVPEDISLSDDQQKIKRQVDRIINDIHNRKLRNVAIPSSLAEGYKISIAKAYYEKGMLQKALDILKEFPQRNEYQYYRALSYYNSRNYEEARKLFALQTTFHSKFYWAMCLMHKANAMDSQDTPQTHDIYKQALELFISIENDFAEDINFLEAMADIYSKDAPFGDNKKAEHYLQRCVAKKPMVVRYATKLGKIYLSQKKYYAAFTLARKVLYVNNDLDAAELLHEIPYHEPLLREQCYQAISYKFLKESIMPCPDLLHDKWKNWQQHYRELYIAWLKGQQQLFSPKTLRSKIESVVRSLSKLSKNSKTPQETLYRTLLSLRYNKPLNAQVESMYKDLPTWLTTKISVMLQQINEIRYREKRAMIFHQLFYTQYNNIWLYNPFEKEEDVQLLVHMLTDENDKTSVQEKYLLAKGCLYFKGFEPLLHIVNDHQVDLITRIVTAVVLRENYLAVQLPLREYLANHLEVSPQEDKFLKILIARALYTSHLRKPLDCIFRNLSPKGMIIAESEKAFLYKLMKNKKDNTLRLRIAAAASLHCLLHHKDDMPLFKESAKFLVNTGMESDSPLIRQYTHYMFWIKKHIEKGAVIPKKKLVEVFRRGINDKNNKVKEVVFSFSEKYGFLLKAVIKDIEDCLRKETNRTVRLRAMFAYSAGKNRDEFIFDSNIYKKSTIEISPLENSATFIFNFYQFFRDLRDRKSADMNNIFRAFGLLSKIIDHLPNLPKSSQCMITYKLSLINIHLPLQKITDAKLLSYLLYQLHQEIDFGEQKAKFPIPNTKSRNEKRRMAQNFLQHPQLKVRRAATVAYISLGSLNQLEVFYQNHKGDTEIAAEIAQGINLFMQNYWMRNSKKATLQFDDVFSWRTDDLVLYKKLKKMREFFHELRQQTPAISHKLRYWLDKSCELDPSNSRSIATRAFFYFDHGTFFTNINKIFQLTSHKKERKDKEQNVNNEKVGVKSNRYIQYAYLLNAAKMLQEKSPNPVEIVKHQGWGKVLSPKVCPHSLLPDLGHYYVNNHQYSLALRAYEKNFLARIDDFSPFKNFRDNAAIINICCKMKNTKLAQLLFECLFELYRREKEGDKAIEKSVFLKRLQKDYPDIDVDFGK